MQFSWFLQASVLTRGEDCISFQTRPKLTLKFVLKRCCWNLFNLCRICFAIWLHVSAKLNIDYSVCKQKCGFKYFIWALLWGKLKFFKKFITVAGSLLYKWGNLGIKISHGCQEIEFCPVGFFRVTYVGTCRLHQLKTVLMECSSCMIW